MIYEIFKWVFQPEQKMGKNQEECRHASKKTGTNNGGFSVSRNGDVGPRAAGEILPPFLLMNVIMMNIRSVWMTMCAFFVGVFVKMCACYRSIVLMIMVQIIM